MATMTGQDTACDPAAKTPIEVEMSQRQFEALGQSVMELKEKLDALAEFLGLSISKNYKKYDVRELRRLSQEITDTVAKPPKRGLFSFLRKSK